MVSLNLIHQLTSTYATELYVLVSLGADWEWAFYSQFSVGDADSKYRLSVGGYKGNAGNSLGWQNGRGWTAPDQDNDAWLAGNCSASNGPGWHKACC